MQNLDHVIESESPGPMQTMLRGIPPTLWALLLLALLLPALLTGWFAWHRHTAILNDVQLTAQRSVLALEQHLGNVLQTHMLLLRQIADRTHGQTWEQIAADKQLQQTIAQLVVSLEQVSLIAIADANGSLRVNCLQQPVDGLTITDRDFFIAHKNGTAKGTFFSQPFTGRLNGKRQFAISIARTGPSGEFDGVVFAAVSLDYFTRFWKQFVPSGGYLIPLMREDGTLLMRYPVSDNPERLDPNGPFVSRVRRAPRGLYTAVSQIDGIERINAYSQVKNYPLYISFSVETDTALQKWREEMLPAVVMAAVAAAALIALLLLVIRQSHQQRLAAARWRSVAENLKSEIARRESIEEQLRQAQKMEAFGQLTGGIAHDFNNMLASIVGNLELMRVYLANGAMDNISQCVDRAEAVADRAAAIIQRLLTFARRKTFKAVPVKINTLLQSATDLFEDVVGPGIHIDIILPETSPVALCDPAQLETALLNLVINARDAMPKGGKITIAASVDAPVDTVKTDSDALSQSPSVTLSVSDTGLGMPQHVIDRAFEPFFTTKGIGKGSGLGLSMVFGFAQQSGGHVKITSREQSGTTVTLSLPACRDEVQDDEHELAPAELQEKAFAGTVLLVEDDAEVRHVLAEVLRQSGATVLQATSAEDALNVMTTASGIDLVVTDIGLPGELNGYQLANTVRRTQAGLPFLFISGYSNRVESADATVQPQDRVMSKPFKISALLATLADMRRNGTATVQ